MILIWLNILYFVSSYVCVRDENRERKRVYIIFYSSNLLTSNCKILFHCQQQLVTFNTFINIRLNLVLNFEILFSWEKNYHIVIFLLRNCLKILKEFFRNLKWKDLLCNKFWLISEYILSIRYIWYK